MNIVYTNILIYILLKFIDSMLHYTPQLKGVEDAVGSRSAIVVFIVAVMPLWYAVCVVRH